MSKKIHTGEIDEKALLASIYAKKNPDQVELPKKLPVKGESEVAEENESVKTKDSGKKKRRDSDDYRSIFLNRNELKTRRCVYISLEVHEKIQKIVKSIASNDISVGGYVDTVLWQHLEANKDEINELYRQHKEKDDHII